MRLSQLQRSTLEEIHRFVELQSHKSEAYFKKGCQRGVAVADMNCKQVDSHGGFRAINICAAAHGYNGQQKL